MKVATTDPSGSRKVYEVKPLDKLTVRDWQALTFPELSEDIIEDFDRLIELLRRHTGIPRKALDKMPAKDVRLLADAMALMLVEVKEAREKAETGAPKEFTFRKVKYLVPQNIEQDLTFGQRESLVKVLLPNCKTDAEGYTAVLAVCCLPQGEEFDGSKVKETRELFMDLPLRTALEVCAFFFDNSEQLRSVMNLIAQRARTSLRHRVGQILTGSTRNSTALG